jgi:hypothetical protein
MKQFKGRRKFDEVISKFKELGFEADTREYDRGSDYVTFIGNKIGNRRITTVYWNAFNYKFSLYNNRGFVADHRSQEFDSAEWYSKILDVFYI